MEPAAERLAMFSHWFLANAYALGSVSGPTLTAVLNSEAVSLKTM